MYLPLTHTSEPHHTLLIALDDLRARNTLERWALGEGWLPVAVSCARALDAARQLRFEAVLMEEGPQLTPLWEQVVATTGPGGTLLVVGREGTEAAPLFNLGAAAVLRPPLDLVTLRAHLDEAAPGPLSMVPPPQL